MNKWYLTVGNKSKPKLLESYCTLTHDNYDVTFSERELEGDPPTFDLDQIRTLKSITF